MPDTHDGPILSPDEARLVSEGASTNRDHGLTLGDPAATPVNLDDQTTETVSAVTQDDHQRVGTPVPVAHDSPLDGAPDDRSGTVDDPPGDRSGLVSGSVSFGNGMTTSPSETQSAVQLLDDAGLSYTSETGRVTGSVSPVNLDVVKMARWRRQERVLQAYGRVGTLYAASQVSGVPWPSVFRWLQEDNLGFRKRVDPYQREYADRLERQMFEALEQAEPRDLVNHPVLAIFALKGARPDKYRDTIYVAEDSSRELLAKLTELQRQRRGLPAATDTVRPQLPAADDNRQQP